MCHDLRSLLLVTVLAVMLIPVPSVIAQEGDDPDRFQVSALAPGIDLYRPVTGRGYTNSLVIDREDGLLVVDAQPSPAAARDLLASIAGRTQKPVRYLVFSHPHLDASGGSPAFDPAVLRIASRGYRDAIADPEYDFSAESRARTGEGFATEGIQRPKATLVLLGRTRLEDERNPIILLPLHRAHTSGDLLVFQPDAGVVAAGDLLFHDKPPFVQDARMITWLAQLNHLMTMSPKWVAPMRGPAVEIAGVRKQRDALIWLRDQVEEAFVDRVEPEQIPADILASGQLGRHFNATAGRELMLALINKVVAETLQRRREMGLE